MSLRRRGKNVQRRPGFLPAAPPIEMCTSIAANRVTSPLTSASASVVCCHLDITLSLRCPQPSGKWNRNQGEEEEVRWRRRLQDRRTPVESGAICQQCVTRRSKEGVKQDISPRLIDVVHARVSLRFVELVIQGGSAGRAKGVSLPGSLRHARLNYKIIER